MPSAFLNDPGIPDPPVEKTLQADADSSITPAMGIPKNLQVVLGEDNPFFDFRRRQSPGGTGFYKIQTQFSLFDTPTTGCSLTCRAVTPAGIEWEGVNEGPTFVSPTLTLFHDLGGGTVFQGFLGKDLFANSRWRESMDESIQYGLAWQQPVLSVAPDLKRGLFVFLEALGRYRDQGDRPGVLHAWELLPGLHLRMNEDWWLSGGVIVPVGPTRPESGLWHITCSRQF
jgi:hypothetical protein